MSVDQWLCPLTGVEVFLHQTGQDSGSKNALIDTSGIRGPSTSTFRPPPGFMDAENPTAEVIGPFDPEEARDALNRLRVSAGHWHELAKLLPRLAAAGYDSKTVENETGLERARQNSWMVAQQVRDTSDPHVGSKLLSSALNKGLKTNIFP